jgi:hypothetical protein
MRPERKNYITPTLTKENRTVPVWKDIIKIQFDTKETETVEDYGAIVEKHLGCEAHHIGQYFFLQAWIELGGPLIKELNGDKNWTNIRIQTLSKFDGRKCKNKRLADKSYRWLFDELKSEHSELIQRKLCEDTKFVAAMLEVNSNKFSYLVSDDVQKSAEEYLKKEALENRIKAQALEIESLKEALALQKQEKQLLEQKHATERDLKKQEMEALEVKLTATKQDLENNKKAVTSVMDERAKVVERLKESKEMNKTLRKEIAAGRDPETGYFVANRAGNFDRPTDYHHGNNRRRQGPSNDQGRYDRNAPWMNSGYGTSHGQGDIPPPSYPMTGKRSRTETNSYGPQGGGGEGRV